MKRTIIRTNFLIVLLVGALALTACGAAGPASTATTQPAGTTPATTIPTTTSPATTTPATTAPTTTAPTTAAPTTSPATTAPTTAAPATTPATTAPGKLSFRYDFSKGDNGWTAGFSDYSKGMEEGIEFKAGIAPLPEELKQLGQAYRLSSKNISDDVFMYVKRKLGKADGIMPSRAYKALIEISFATSAFAGSVGIGGSPAESVFVKVGVAPLEPKTVPSTNMGPDYLALSVDKGSQNGGGRYAVQIGNVAKTDGSKDNRYSVKTLSNKSQELTITSDANGELWVFIGTDSGFEGITTLYYTSVSVTLSE